MHETWKFHFARMRFHFKDFNKIPHHLTANCGWWWCFDHHIFHVNFYFTAIIQWLYIAFESMLKCLSKCQRKRNQVCLSIRIFPEIVCAWQHFRSEQSKPIRKSIDTQIKFPFEPSWSLFFRFFQFPYQKQCKALNFYWNEPINWWF